VKGLCVVYIVEQILEINAGTSMIVYCPANIHRLLFKRITMMRI